MKNPQLWLLENNYTKMSFEGRALFGDMRPKIHPTKPLFSIDHYPSMYNYDKVRAETILGHRHSLVACLEFIVPRHCNMTYKAAASHVLIQLKRPGDGSLFGILWEDTPGLKEHLPHTVLSITTRFCTIRR
jgi:hypothetical protein